MSGDGGTEFCDIAASCICGGAYIHAENVPADGVIEATITSSFEARVTATFGNVGSFAVGDTLCVDQSVVGATILVPVRVGGDAEVVGPPPDGGTCVPNFAFTVLLDDGGRPLACNDGTTASLSLTTTQTISALQAPDCKASLVAIDSRWSEDECASGGGCTESPHASLHALAWPIAAALVFTVGRRTLRRSRRSTSRASRS